MTDPRLEDIRDRLDDLIDILDKGFAAVASATWAVAASNCGCDACNDQVHPW